MFTFSTDLLIYDLRVIRTLLSPDGNQESLICPESHWDALVRICLMIEEIEDGHTARFIASDRSCTEEAGLGSE